MLCDLCQDLDLDALLSAEGYQHHQSWEDLVAAARKGCELCKLLERYPYDTWSDVKAVSASAVFNISPRFRIRGRVQANINVVTDFDDPVTTIATWKGVASDNKSRVCFDRIDWWINECVKNHKNCIQAKDYPLPTRLLDVGNASKPFLVVNDHTKTGKWITLSHCWGKHMSLTTTGSNLSDHQDGIDISAFPQNFQDAIYITRRLGHRYIWIDSLCIIQDSREDWLQQSADMGRIYRESFLTIAADQAESSTHGVFASAIRQGNGWPVYVTTSCHSELREMKGQICLRTPTIDTEGTIPSPLSRRAWTLQETTLSPRVLRYSFEELFWSCNEGLFSESAPDVPRDFDRDHKKVLKRSQNSSLSSAKESMISWYGIMRDYAYRKITFDTDRLIAISGLSRIVKDLTGCTYRAGLWLKDIHYRLLWRTPGDFEKAETYTAPSWSWASVLSMWGDFTKTEIHLYDDALMRSKLLKDHYAAEILEVNVENVAGNIYGQLISASLRIRGACRTFEELEGLDATSEIDNDALNVLSYEFDVETDFFDGCFDDLSGRGVICMQIGKFQMDDESKIYALILEPVGSTQEYQRLGRVEIPQKDGLAEGWERREICII